MTYILENFLVREYNGSISLCYWNRKFNDFKVTEESEFAAFDIISGITNLHTPERSGWYRKATEEDIRDLFPESNEDFKMEYYPMLKSILEEETNLILLV